MVALTVSRAFTGLSQEILKEKSEIIELVPNKNEC